VAVLRFKQIKEINAEDLEKRLQELRLELAKEMTNVRTGRPIKNPGKIGELRRAIAKILTFKEQKKRLKASTKFVNVKEVKEVKKSTKKQTGGKE